MRNSHSQSPVLFAEYTSQNEIRKIHPQLILLLTLKCITVRHPTFQDSLTVDVFAATTSFSPCHMPSTLNPGGSHRCQSYKAKGMCNTRMTIIFPHHPGCDNRTSEPDDAHLSLLLLRTLVTPDIPAAAAPSLDGNIQRGEISYEIVNQTGQGCMRPRVPCSHGKM